MQLPYSAQRWHLLELANNGLVRITFKGLLLFLITLAEYIVILVQIYNTYTLYNISIVFMKLSRSIWYKWQLDRIETKSGHFETIE